MPQPTSTIAASPANCFKRVLCFWANEQIEEMKASITFLAGSFHTKISQLFKSLYLGSGLTSIASKQHGQGVQLHNHNATTGKCTKFVQKSGT